DVAVRVGVGHDRVTERRGDAAEVGRAALVAAVPAFLVEFAAELIDLAVLRVDRVRPSAGVVVVRARRGARGEDRAARRCVACAALVVRPQFARGGFAGSGVLPRGGAWGEGGPGRSDLLPPRRAA